jgi:hypothetical protein
MRTDWEHDGNKSIKKFHPQLTRPPRLLQSTPYLINCPLNSHAEYVPWVLILCPSYHLTYPILTFTTDQLHKERAMTMNLPSTTQFLPTQTNTTFAFIYKIGALWPYLKWWFSTIQRFVGDFIIYIIPC